MPKLSFVILLSLLPVVLFSLDKIKFPNLQSENLGCAEVYTIGSMVLDSSNFYQEGVPEFMADAIKKRKYDNCSSKALLLTIYGFNKFIDDDVIESRSSLLRADSIYRLNNDLDSRFHIRNNIFLGLSYGAKGDTIKSFQFLRVAEAMSLKSGNIQLLSDALNNIGLQYMDALQLDKAEKCLIRASRLAEQSDNKEIYAFSALNLSHVYRRQKKWEQALNKVLEAEQGFKSLHDNRHQYLIEITKADLLSELGEYTRAIEKYEKALVLGDGNGNKTLHGTSYYALAKLYEKIGDDSPISNYEKAIKHPNSLTESEYDESIEKLRKNYLETNNIEKFNSILTDMANFQTVKKELFKFETLESSRAEISMQKEKAQNATLRLKNEANMRMLTIILLASVICLLLAVYAYNQLRKNRRLTGKLTAAKQALEKQNIELKNFAYMASHDLKSPANSIASFAELIKMNVAGKPNTDSDTIQFIDIILNSAKDMSSLVSSLLEFSSIENSDSTFSKVSMHELFEQVKNNLFTLIDEKNAVINISGKIPKNIVGDEIKLKTVFQNIINNGIKFVPNGRQPSIEIDYSNTSTDHIFSIKDNGIGMDEKHISKVFFMFQRLNNKSEFAGSGIGLSTCKKIIDHHNGSIKVESKLDHGSTFHIHIPKNLEVNHSVLSPKSESRTAIRSTLS